MSVTYRLGVDLGTTWTAAAVARDGAPAMLGLGNRALQIPSVIFFDSDGRVVIGEAAERRAVADPSRVAREFKRRLGDPVPIMVAGTSMSAQTLLSRLLRHVVDLATEREGEAPSLVGVTHPANWGPYKAGLLDQVITLAGLDAVATYSEPAAAARHYVSRARLTDGDRIVVYDLGGGTFDVCVLQKHAEGFHVLGTPQGIEHLGGVDFDEAIFAHATSAIQEHLQGLDPDSPAVRTGLTHFRRSCVEAKESLSQDVAVDIPVLLPGLTTSVRLTRSELEDMIRPSLEDSVLTTIRGIRSAGLEAADLSAIVLVGGSSRIPLVHQLLAAQFDCEISRDTHPKHDVALGAAWLLTDSLPSGRGPVPPVPDPSPTAPPPPVVDDHPTAAGSPVAPPRRRRRTALIAGAVVVALATAAWLTILATSGDPDAEPSPVRVESSTVFDAQEGRIRGVAVSPDGRLLASASIDDDVWLVDSVTGERRGAPLPAASDTCCVAFSPDGETLASAGADGTVELWDVVTGRRAGAALQGPTQSIAGVAFSPDGATLAAASRDSTVTLWDTGSGRVRHVERASGPVISLAYRPDGRVLASAGRDRVVRLWNTSDGTQLGAPLTGPTGTVAGLAFSPDGTTLAAASLDSRVWLWTPGASTTAGRPLSGHTGGVESVAFRPDGSLLASGSQDGTVRLWNPRTGRQVHQELRGPTQLVSAVAFGDDGGLLLAGSFDSTVTRWTLRDVSSNTARATARPRAADVAIPMRRAADYYRGSYAVATGVRNGWSWSTYFDGVLELHRETGDADALDDLMAWGQHTGWTVTTREEDANEIKAAQLYHDLHEIDETASLTSADARMRVDLALPTTAYTWVDALFMTMPSWVRWAERTGDPAYLDTMDRLYRWTRDQGIAPELPCAGKAPGLYDPDERLWYRDCRFIGERDGGEKIFWGRGNAWVAAAMAQTVRQLGPEHPRAQPYVTMLRDMASRLRELQGADGMWRASLLNPRGYPAPETSATGLFTYAVAEGIDLGVLDRASYSPVVLKAWRGLTTIALQPTGFLSRCQRVSDRPDAPYPGTAPRIPASSASPGTLHTDAPPFCVGAFLLAGAGVTKLVER